MQSVLLASTSTLKLEVVQKVFPDEEYIITTVNCDSCGLPSQPYNSAARCAKVRLNYAKKVTFPKVFDYYIAIENGIDRFVSERDVDYEDICHVLVEHKGLLVHSIGTIEYDIPRDKMGLLFKEEKVTISELSILGYSRSIGDIFHDEDSSIDSKNWVMSVYKCDRRKQVEDSLREAMNKLHQKQKFATDIISKYKSYPGPIIHEAADVQNLIKLMKSHCKYDSIDYVAGAGFLGVGLSCACNYGFIPLLKKRNFTVVKNDPSLSACNAEDSVVDEVKFLTYGTDIASGSRVVVFDDVIATGASLRAACDLLEQLGCIIVDCIVLREVVALRSVAQNKLGRPYTVLLQY